MADHGVGGGRREVDEAAFGDQEGWEAGIDVCENGGRGRWVQATEIESVDMVVRRGERGFVLGDV